MPDLCVCMAWLMSLFKCSSLLSVGSFALIIVSFLYLCSDVFRKYGVVRSYFAFWDVMFVSVK